MIDQPRARRSTLSCLFCGRPWAPGQVSKSREHVLGQWIMKLEDNHPPEHRSFSAGFELDDAAKELMEIQPEIVFRKAALLTMTTREVCEDCNQGWMSDLEETVKPVILQLARSAKTGIATLLNWQAAQTLAVWAEKTALTYELTSDASHVGNIAMGQVLRAGAPLRGSFVWVGHNSRDYDISIGLEHIDISATPIPRPGPPDRQALLVTVIYHHITIFVFITGSPGETFPPRLSPTQWTLVWPLFKLGSIEYPPMTSVSGTELTELFTQPGRWIPPVHVAIRRSNLPPNIRRRN